MFDINKNWYQSERKYLKLLQVCKNTLTRRVLTGQKFILISAFLAVGCPFTPDGGRLFSFKMRRVKMFFTVLEEVLRIFIKFDLLNYKLLSTLFFF